MPYIEGRVVHDADAHIMEEPTWLGEHADPDVREQLLPRTDGLGLAPGRGRAARALPAAPHRARSSATATPRRSWQRKNFKATRLVHRRGPARWPSTCSAWPASSSSTRSTTAGSCASSAATTSTSPTAPPAPTTAAMVEFCSVDDRLLPTCYVPLADFERSAAMAGEAHRRWARPRCSSPSACPRGHSPSHIGPRPGVAPGRGGRHPDRAARRRRRAAHRPDVLRERRPVREGLPRRRRELPLGRLHGHPRSGPSRCSPR